MKFNLSFKSFKLRKVLQRWYIIYVNNMYLLYVGIIFEGLP